jgi:predicted RNase H-like nuclease (RuvC/YqgF family)
MLKKKKKNGLLKIENLCSDLLCHIHNLNIVNRQQKAEHLEDKLSDMNRVQSQMKDGNRNAYNVQVMQLQQQVTDLRSSLADVNVQNEDLEKTCMQLQLKLEHYKRYMRNQDKDMKVRKEIQQLLEHNEDEYFENIDQVS